MDIEEETYEGRHSISNLAMRGKNDILLKIFRLNCSILFLEFTPSLVTCTSFEFWKFNRIPVCLSSPANLTIRQVVNRAKSKASV